MVKNVATDCTFKALFITDKKVDLAIGYPLKCWYMYLLNVNFAKPLSKAAGIDL